MTSELTKPEREELRRQCEEFSRDLFSTVLVLRLLDALDEADERIAELKADVEAVENPRGRPDKFMTDNDWSKP